jgi:hypothetical protein
MSSERLNNAKIRLNAYYAAELAVLSGQEYKIGTRTMRKADLSVIKQTIKELENYVTELESVEEGKGRNRMIGVIPRDI